MPNGNDPLTVFSIEDLERMLPARRQPFVQPGVQPFQTPAVVQGVQGIADIVNAIRGGRQERQLREATTARRQALIDLATGGGAPQPPTTVGGLGVPPDRQPIGGLPLREEPRAEGRRERPISLLGRAGRGVGRFFGRLTRPPELEGIDVPPNLPELISQAYARSPAEGETVRAAASEALGIDIPQPKFPKSTKTGPLSRLGKELFDIRQDEKAGFISSEDAERAKGVLLQTEVGAKDIAKIASTEEIAAQNRNLRKQITDADRGLRALDLGEEANRANDKRALDAEQAALAAWDKRSKGRRLTPKLKLARETAGLEARVSEMRKIAGAQIARGQARVPQIVTDPGAARALAGVGAPPAGAAVAQPGGSFLDVLLASEEEEQ